MRQIRILYFCTGYRKQQPNDPVVCTKCTKCQSLLFPNWSSLHVWSSVLWHWQMLRYIWRNRYGPKNLYWGLLCNWTRMHKWIAVLWSWHCKAKLIAGYMWAMLFEVNVTHWTSWIRYRCTAVTMYAAEKMGRFVSQMTIAAEIVIQITR